MLRCTTLFQGIRKRRYMLPTYWHRMPTNCGELLGRITDICTFAGKYGGHFGTGYYQIRVLEPVKDVSLLKWYFFDYFTAMLVAWQKMSTISLSKWWGKKETCPNRTRSFMLKKWSHKNVTRRTSGVDTHSGFVFKYIPKILQECSSSFYSTHSTAAKTFPHMEFLISPIIIAVTNFIFVIYLIGEIIFSV